MANVTKPIALDESFNTTGNSPKNIAQVLEDNGADLITQATAIVTQLQALINAVKPSAGDIPLDPIAGMNADDVQEGISELKGTLTSLAYPSNSEQLDTRSVSSSEVTINLTATHDGVMQIYYTNSGGSSIGFTVRIREANTKRGMLFNANIPPYMMDEPLICIPCRAGVSYGILYRRTASSGSVDFTIKNLY